MNISATPQEFQLALDHCARQPLHIPGTIQSCGAVVAFDRQQLIQSVSDNLLAKTGIEPTEALGKTLTMVFGLPLALEVKALQACLSEGQHRLLPAHPHSATCQLLFHHYQGQGVLEWLPTQTPSQDPDLTGCIEELACLLGLGTGWPEFAETAAELFRKASGYDRVMIYRFLPGGDGCVVQERGLEIRLIIMDLTMPILSGREAISRIQEVYPELPIIVMSGYEARLNEKGTPEEFPHFLHKPFSAEELFAKVRLLVAT